MWRKNITIREQPHAFTLLEHNVPVNSKTLELQASGQVLCPKNGKDGFSRGST